MRTNPNTETVAAIAALYDEQPHYRALNPAAIKACIGCWSCWVKTPGRCVCKDSMAEACPDYVNAEKVILLMNTAQGFINHSAKAFIDRTIPHYHPYIEIVDIERFQLQPAKEQEKILTPFVELVGSVLENGYMSAPLLAKLADPEYLSKGPLFLFKLVAPTGVLKTLHILKSCNLFKSIAGFLDLTYPPNLSEDRGQAGFSGINCIHHQN